MSPIVPPIRALCLGCGVVLVAAIRSDELVCAGCQRTDHRGSRRRSECRRRLSLAIDREAYFSSWNHSNTGGGLEDDVPIVGHENLPALPPVTAGTFTPEIQERVESFFHSVAAIFEAWVNRRKSLHTRRAYRGDVMAFVEFRGLSWPEAAPQLLRMSILDVQEFRDDMLERGGASSAVSVHHRL